MFLRNTFKLVFAGLVLILSGSLAKAQIIGSDAYLIGDHIEIGINGSGGHEGAAFLPASNNRSNLAVSSPVYFGFVANPQLDSWATYDGDFFTPGSPENSFGMEINGTNYTNSASGTPGTPEITGDIVSYEEIDDCIIVVWEGTAGGVTIRLKYRLLASNLFYTTEVTMINDSDSDLVDAYYYRNTDPDNNVTIGGGYATTNTIVSQADSTCQKSLVSAEQDRPVAAGPGTSYVGFGALGENFRVARGGFFNRDASDIWNGTGALTGVEGSSLFSDQAIAIAYKSDILSGDSITFTFATVLSDGAVEEAFEGLYFIGFEAVGVSGGSAASECNVSVDTAETCGGNPVFLTVNGPNTEDFDWVWSPTDGLSDSTGTTTTATPTETTTYTVTGTPTEGCLTEPIVKTIVIEYLDGPLISITAPDPSCGPFDLNTLVFEDLNDVSGTNIDFYSEIPDSATAEGPLWPSDFIVEGDSVYLVIADTVNGCFDFALVEVEFGSGGNAGADNAVAYCNGTNDTLDINTLIDPDADEGGTLSEVGDTGGAYDSGTGLLYLEVLEPGVYEFIYVVGTAPCPIDTATYTVTIYPDLDVTISATDASCGVDDGTATAIVSGGEGPYAYAWSNGETTASIDGLAPGLYTVMVTDANGCTGSAAVEIDGLESDMEIDKLSIKHVTCPGGDDGYIYIVMEGGVAPYTYLWSTGDTGSGISGLSAGVYTVVVTDALGCTFTEAFEVMDGEPIDVSVTVDGYYLTANQDSATYQWVTCPDYEPIDGETGQTFCVPPYCDDVEYAVIITTEDGCVDTSDCYTAEEDPGLTVGENGMMEILIYPNPSSGQIFVRVDNLEENYELTVLDAKGSLVLTRTMTDNIEMIDLTQAADGMYFIQVKSENATITRRVSVNK